MRQLRIYVAVPLTHCRNNKHARRICDFLMENGAEVTSPWVAKEDAKQCFTPEQVYRRDVDAVKGSDAMVAELSVPSLGIGMEIMVAQNKDIPIVCLHDKKINVSWMVVGCPCVRLIPYSSERIDEALKEAVVLLEELLP